MKTTAKKTIGMMSAVILTTVVFGYGYFRMKDFLQGPVLGIVSPKNGEVFASALMSIEGTSKNISFLNLDGRKIFTDKDGVWGEKLLLQPGVNIIEVQAKDRFGREKKEVMRVVYDNKNTDTPI